MSETKKTEAPKTDKAEPAIIVKGYKFEDGKETFKVKVPGKACPANFGEMFAYLKEKGVWAEIEKSEAYYFIFQTEGKAERTHRIAFKPRAK